MSQTSAVLKTISADTYCSDRNDPVYRAALIEECGKLGVMEVPEGVPESDVRHCAEHPLGRDVDFGNDYKRGPTSVHNRHAADIFPKDALKCYWGDKPWGCMGGKCFKKCGARGNWGWTAQGAGYGDWDRCKYDTDCGWNFHCSMGTCGACGCSC